MYNIIKPSNNNAIVTLDRLHCKSIKYRNNNTRSKWTKHSLMNSVWGLYKSQNFPFCFLPFPPLCKLSHNIYEVSLTETVESLVKHFPTFLEGVTSTNDFDKQDQVQSIENYSQFGFTLTLERLNHWPNFWNRKHHSIHDISPFMLVYYD